MDEQNTDVEIEVTQPPAAKVGIRYVTPKQANERQVLAAVQGKHTQDLTDRELEVLKRNLSRGKKRERNATKLAQVEAMLAAVHREQQARRRPPPSPANTVEY